MKIEQHDPLEFKPAKFHPSLKLIPELAPDSEEFLALAATVKRAGFIRPILIDAEGRIVDDHSRALWRVALRWQLKTVPCQVVEDANLALIHSLKDVRHLTKSAIAYLLLPVFENSVRAALAEHRQKLSKGQYIAVVRSADNSGIPEAPTLDKLADDLGFGRTTLYQARAVHAAFLDDKQYSFDVTGGAEDGQVKLCTLKEWFEPKILRSPVGGEHEQNRPLGLGAVIAGIQGLVRTKDKERGETHQPELFSKQVIAGCINHLKNFKASKSEALAALRKKADELQPEVCDELSEMYSAMAKIYRDRARVNS